MLEGPVTGQIWPLSGSAGQGVLYPADWVKECPVSCVLPLPLLVMIHAAAMDAGAVSGGGPTRAAFPTMSAPQQDRTPYPDRSRAFYARPYDEQGHGQRALGKVTDATAPHYVSPNVTQKAQAAASPHPVLFTTKAL